MATPKAVAIAEQAARDKTQATLDRILRNIQKMMDKMGLEEDKQPEAELPGETTGPGQAPVVPAPPARQSAEAANQEKPKEESKLSQASRNVARQVTRK